MNKNKQSLIERWLEDKNCLISLPEICFKIRTLLDNPLHSRNEVAGLIQHDPVLTARLLKLVNSAFYSLPYPVDNISDSIGLIGDKYLKDLIVTATIVESFNNVATKIPNFDIKQFWSSSMFCAVLARNIASICQEDIQEDMFIAGLLLNIGKLPMYFNVPSLLTDLREQQESSGIKKLEIEQNELGFDHTDIGAILAKTWNFSESLSSVIANHHLEPANQEPLSRHITFLANLLKCHLGNSLKKPDHNLNSEDKEELEDDLLPAEFKPILSIMGLSENLVESVIETSQRDFTDIYSTFCAT